MTASRAVVAARRLAILTDRAVRIPFTRFEFGLDAILGLFPGAGDAAGALLSAYVIGVGVKEGVSGATLVRMVGNVALEALVGIVPLLGDVFDAGWKANVRNVRLIDRHLEAPAAQRRASALIVGGAALGLLGVAGVAIWSTVWVVRGLVSVAVAVGWPGV